MYLKGSSGEMPIAPNVRIKYNWDHRDILTLIKDGVFLVANAQLEDFPIVYVSDKFTGKMGYTRADLIGQPITLDFMGNKEATSMLQQYLVNISRTSTKLLPQLEEGPSFQTEGPLTKKNGMPRLCRIRMSCRG